uniref:Uncharacterized protein n=1 Tax=Trypanosoma vivax (strain Y486) TaxID=1055687 RepID=G0U1F3_TRYVY|nr:hypothetical protein TVY486_0805160 [Trypanosoma vivax Y486]
MTVALSKKKKKSKMKFCYVSSSSSSFFFVLIYVRVPVVLCDESQLKGENHHQNPFQFTSLYFIFTRFCSNTLLSCWYHRFCFCFFFFLLIVAYYHVLLYLQNN